MDRIRRFLCAAPLMLAACASVSDRNGDTIAGLRHVQTEIKERRRSRAGLRKRCWVINAFWRHAGFRLDARAIRRLADLKIQKEYGTLTTGDGAAGRAPALPPREPATRPKVAKVAGAPPGQELAHIPVHDASEADFEKRATMRQPVDSMALLPTRLSRAPMISKGQAPARPSRFTRSSSTITPATSATTRCCTSCPAHMRNWGRPRKPWRSWTGWSATFPVPIYR